MPVRAVATAVVATAAVATAAVAREAVAREAVKAQFNPPMRKLAVGAPIDRPSTTQQPNTPTGGGVGAPPDRPIPPQQTNAPNNTAPGGGVGAPLDRPSTTQQTNAPTGGGVGAPPDRPIPPQQPNTTTGGGVGAPPDRYRPSTTQDSNSNNYTTTGGGVGAPLDRPSTTQESNANAPNSEEETQDPGPSVKSVSTATAVVGGAVYAVGKSAATCTRRKPSQVDSLVGSSGDPQGYCSKAGAVAGAVFEKVDGIPPVVIGTVAIFTYFAKLPVAAPCFVAGGVSCGALGARSIKNWSLGKPESDNPPPTDTIVPTSIGAPAGASSSGADAATGSAGASSSGSAGAGAAPVSPAAGSGAGSRE